MFRISCPSSPNFFPGTDLPFHHKLGNPLGLILQGREHGFFDLWPGVLLCNVLFYFQPPIGVGQGSIFSWIPRIEVALPGHSYGPVVSGHSSSCALIYPDVSASGVFGHNSGCYYIEYRLCRDGKLQ